jgi:hypothetical protein
MYSVGKTANLFLQCTFEFYCLYFAVANPYDVVNVSLQLALYHIVDMVI